MKTWDEIIGPVLASPEMQKVKTFVAERRKTKKVFPEPSEVFNAFKMTPYESIRIVILGQDPYSGDGHSNGIAFASKSSRTPGSLKNIFTEIYNDIYKPIGESWEDCFPTNELSLWCKQGIFLYNTVLTVDENEPNSHKGQGWEVLTEIVIKALNDHPNPIIFMLWGQHARSYAKYITDSKHIIMEATHPSPMSYEQGFKGCGHFKKANDIITMSNPDAVTFDFRKHFNTQAAMEEAVKTLKSMSAYSAKNERMIAHHLKEKIEWNIKFHLASGICWKTGLKNE